MQRIWFSHRDLVSVMSLTRLTTIASITLSASACSRCPGGGDPLREGRQEGDRCFYHVQNQKPLQTSGPARFRQRTREKLLQGANIVLHVGFHRTLFPGASDSPEKNILHCFRSTINSLYHFGYFYFIHLVVAGQRAQKEDRDPRERQERHQHVCVCTQWICRF